jgi:hypothetical protein
MIRRSMDSMEPMSASLVNGGDLLVMTAASAAAGILAAVSVSVAVWGATVHRDFSLEGRGAASLGALAIGSLGALTTIATIAAGLILLASG